MQTQHQSADQRAFSNALDLAIWTFAWVATLALARFGPDHLWNNHAGATWVAIAVNVAAGVGWIVAHTRYLRRIDELQRKIMLDAMAITLGAAWVGGFAYIVAEGAGLVSIDADVALLAVLAGVVYMATVAVSNLRYR